MKAWMLYNKSDAKKNERYISFYQTEGKSRDIEFEVVYVEELDFGIEQSKWVIHYKRRKVERPDFIVCRTIYPMLSKQLEAMGIPVFNNAAVAEICNNKARTYQYVAQLGIPMIETSFCRSQELKERLERCEEKKPMVFKAVAGHGGSQVFLYERGSQLQQDQEQAIVEGLSGCDFVMQPLTGNKHQDLRVYVIGKEMVAAVLRTAKEGFKSNFSLGGNVQLYELKQEEKEVVSKIMGLFEFGLVGIDFLIGDQGELIFNEIEDVVGARMLYQCSDINLVGRYLDYIINFLVDRSNIRC